MVRRQEALATGKPRIAVCLAGAWRHTQLALPTIRSNLIDPLEADVFAVSDGPDLVNGTIGHRNGERAESLTLDDLRAAFDLRFRAGIVLNRTQPGYNAKSAR